MVFDTAISSLEKRFNISSKRMIDLRCLHPFRFKEVQYLNIEKILLINDIIRTTFSTQRFYTEVGPTLRLSLND